MAEHTTDGQHVAGPAGDVPVVGTGPRATTGAEQPAAGGGGHR